MRAPDFVVKSGEVLYNIRGIVDPLKHESIHMF